MRKVVAILCGLILLCSNTEAQSPSWKVIENNFQYTMTFLSFINSDGIVLSSTNDKIGAFVNGECRGVANLIYETSQKRYYAYLTVFSNSESDVVNFKIYDANKNTIKDVIKTVPFVINNHTGSLLQAYCFTNTVLSSSAELTDLNFTNATRKTFAITGNTVSVTIDKAQNMGALNTTYTVSPNAAVFLNGVKLVSGANSVDYTSPVTLQVRSQDETVVKDWIVKLSIPMFFYKKNVVCYAKGEIKVDCPKDGELVALSFNGQQIASQALVNGTTTFKNLNSGVYIATVLGVSKTITIINL